MDSRPVIEVKTEYYWYCPECDHKNEESVIPDTSDLTCWLCGANYKNGSPLSNEVKTVKTIRTVNGSIIRCSADQAAKIVDNRDYFYCDDSEYDKAVQNGTPHVKWDFVLE